ncbi:ATPase, T2SS/T4P/T4SS family [Acidithiobacillus thiooxidans]|uniref:type IV pilus twitching motility protein PilT n=1 Tax=Acidithiobacillus thiooxidans TaxID=930 RepID=UPI00285E9380|nr:ATPase, T2SS/T4P/T4SS family [Acidithiobacillus thiooxidans]MDR7927132.1 ATPase, T2SS/T4P/T4SS family [Acidithiobacillus thiooxidans]
MFSVEDLHRMLIVASDTPGISDLDFMSDHPVFVNWYGDRHVMRRDGTILKGDECDVSLLHECITPDEIRFIANHLFRGAAAQEEMNRTQGGLNMAYLVEEKHAVGHARRGAKHRFRVNMVQGKNTYDETNVQITIRPLPNMVKFPEDYGIPPEIIRHFFHTRGMVLVTGPTGSGKTTLLASILRDWLERSTHSLKIITAEDPIEIVLQEVIHQMLLSGRIPKSFIHHAEIPGNLKTFSLSIREAVRRHPNAALFGELRDRESIDAALELVLTGHLVLSTTHTTGVGSTIDRLISGFPTEEKPMKKQDLVYSLRLVVSQLLVKTADGKQTAIREYLPFTTPVRKVLLETPIEHLYPVIDRLLQQYGRPMIRDIEDRYRDGLITEATYRTLEEEHGLV